MTKERKKSTIYIRFAVGMLVCAALGAIGGWYVGAAENDLFAALNAFNRTLAAPGLWWFAPGYLLLAVGTVYFFRAKSLLPQAEANDHAFEEADRRLCLALILSGVCMVLLFIALGISGHAMLAGPVAILFMVHTLVHLVWIVALQAVTVKATKAIHPEKRGNVFDTKFQKDWYQSCDEAEQQKIGQCSYFCFRLMSTIFPIAMLLLFFLSSSKMVQPGWVLLVGLLWLAQQLSYQCMAYHLDHGKKKGAR
ncbi:DUF3169 family protein [Agathobaculum sp. Marseille-P7918]|uniref:DUF3169 family protein n=1 Tax=Agathobaculum sp. Marseille-P7918 TaxID=2479843 RepID=UPI000F62EA7F|nr:DUF3169 family protein [Agathobaculum sp. Marseille-P7918]